MANDIININVNQLKNYKNLYYAAMCLQARSAVIDANA